MPDRVHCRFVDTRVWVVTLRVKGERFVMRKVIVGAHFFAQCKRICGCDPGVSGLGLDCCVVRVD